MTKNEYIEFLNLQEHYEWLHGAEDRAKHKLETFTTDDSEFDELVREAIKVYFETEIDKAWKQIEEFKTAPTFVTNREGAIRYYSEKKEPEKIYFEKKEPEKVYFETEIDKAWKQIEEFKTATTKTEKVPKKVKIVTDRVYTAFKASDLEAAKKACTSGPCGHTTCPLMGWRDCICIWNAYDNGDYEEG